MKDDLASDKAIEKLVAGKLRAQLKLPGPECPDAEFLAAYVDDALTSGERARCEAHLAACAPCQEQVAELVRLSAADKPAAATAAPPAKRKEIEGTRRAAIFGFRWAWAATALAAALVAGLWYTEEFRERLQPIPQVTAPAPVAGPETTPPSVIQSQSKSAAAESSPPERSATVAPAEARKAPPREKKVAPSQAQAPAAPKALQAADQAGVPANLQAAQAEAEQQPAKALPRERARLTSREAGASPSEPQPPAKGAEAEAETRNEPLEVPLSAPPGGAPSAPSGAGEGAKAQKAAPQTASPARGGFAGRRLESLRATEASATSETRLWRVGPQGLIQKKDSSGNWKTQSSGVASDLIDITFPTPSVGWAVGQAGTILRTTDGGNTWNKVPGPTSQDLLRVVATGELAANVTTRRDQTWVTSDGGKTWRASPRE